MTDTPNPFKEGDVLRLKSGGPKMTVLKVDADGCVSCKWFDRNGKIHTDSFTSEMVEKFISQW